MVELYQGVDSKALFVGIMHGEGDEVSRIALTVAANFADDAAELAENGRAAGWDKGVLCVGPGAHRSNCSLTVFQRANAVAVRPEPCYEPVDLIARWADGVVKILVPADRLGAAARQYLESGVVLENVVADRIELHGIEGGVQAKDVNVAGGINITDVRR